MRPKPLMAIRVLIASISREALERFLGGALYMTCPTAPSNGWASQSGRAPGASPRHAAAGLTKLRAAQQYHGGAVAAVARIGGGERHDAGALGGGASEPLPDRGAQDRASRLGAAAAPVDHEHDAYAAPAGRGDEPFQRA